MKAIAALLLGLFPFSMPWNDASKTVVDVSHLNPAPLTAQHQVASRAGHFYNRDGKRVRFLGVNLAWSACFPDKDDAPVIAARMRKLGINLVRMHNFDVGFAPRGIFDKKQNDWRQLDTDQLDRFDYFIYQLKQHGIYTDLNLLVGRDLGAAEAGQASPPSGYTKRIGPEYFYPPFIRLQKEFARELLTHVNPYTNNRYTVEPAIALVEIINERTLVGQGTTNLLQTLQPSQQKVLNQGWNRFLQDKYQTTDQLKQAWYPAGQAAGKNILQNSGFEAGLLQWKIERNAPVEATAQVVETTAAPAIGREFTQALHLQIEQSSPHAWHLQVHQLGLDLAPQQLYTLTFWAKSDEPRTMQATLKNDHVPWAPVAAPLSFNIDRNWKKYTAAYQTSIPIPRQSSLSFSLGNKTGEVWLAAIELGTGGAHDLPTGQTLEQGNIALPLVSSLPDGVDALAYLSGLEVQYMEEMQHYLKNELGVLAPIIGSQPVYEGLSGVWRDSHLDVVDMHGYWAHPNAVNGGWAKATVSRAAMVDDVRGGILRQFAAHRVEGKPFTVTEFNFCPPNEFRAEGLPMIASFAALQDWDALVLFDYHDNRDNWRNDTVNGFFRMHNDPAMLTMLPVAANLFLRGDVAPLPSQKLLRIPVAQYSKLAVNYSQPRWSAMKSLWESQGLGGVQPLENRWALQFTDDTELSLQTNGVMEAQAVQWQPLGIEGGLFTVDTPATKVIVQHYPRQEATQIVLNGFGIEIDATQNHFAVVTLTAMDSRAIGQSSKILLTLAGAFQNTDFEWNDDGSVKTWGKAPILAEAIPARVRVATQMKKAKVYALDSTGARLKPLPGIWQKGELTFTISPDEKTVWYEIAEKTAP